MLLLNSEKIKTGKPSAPAENAWVFKLAVLSCVPVQLSLHGQGSSEENFCGPGRVMSSRWHIPERGAHSSNLDKALQKCVPQSYMADAQNKLSRASKVVFIGYSLSEADIQVVFTFCKALHQNQLNPSIEIVNPEQRDTIHRRYRRLFGNVTYHKATFAQYVRGTAPV